MRHRNSVNYILKDSKSVKPNINSRHKEINSYNDKILKNIFLNNLNHISKKNIELIKNLNNTFRNYELNLNQKDIKITNNLFNISANRIFNLKNKIKLSEQLFRKYDEQYGSNSIHNFSNINNTTSKLSESKEKKEKTKSNISIDINDKDILKENEEKKYQNLKTEKKMDIKRYSVNCNKKNNARQFMKIIINEKRMEKRIRKVEQLTKLFNAMETDEKKDIVEDNKLFKVDDKKNKFILFYRNNNDKNKKKIGFNYLHNRCRIRKNKNKFLSVEKLMPNGTFVSFSDIKSESNIKDNNNSYSNTFYNSNKKINTNTNSKYMDKQKPIPKILLSSPNNKSKLENNSNITYLKDLQTENTSSRTSNILNASSRNKTNLIISSSFPNFYQKPKNNDKRKYLKIKNSLLNFVPLSKKKFNFRLNISKNRKEMKPMINKTINEGEKINKIIKQNYTLHKHNETNEKDIYLEMLDEKKLNLNKLRKELKLKDSNGIYGSIDEVEIMENNVKNMEKLITKKQINFMKTIVKGIIKEDKLLNKNLVYNVGLDNRNQRLKYFELYKLLTRSKNRKRKIEENNTFN